MGATDFVEIITASSPQEGYKEIVEDYISMYGNDPYNGTMSTSRLGNVVKRYDKYLKRNEDEAFKYVHDENGGEKGVAKVIDLGVVEWRAITIKKKATGNKPSYKMMYVVEKNGGFQSQFNSKLKTFPTKKEADDYAMRYLKDNSAEDVSVKKEYVLISGNSEVTEFTREVKTYKTKPNLKYNENRTIIAYHKYLYFGLASM